MIRGPIAERYDEDIKTKDLESLQKAQNNMLRTLENVRVKDCVSIKSMLERNNMLSINQMHAQIKITEMWKATNFKNYPLDKEKLQSTADGRITRGITEGKLIEPVTLNTFVGNATRLWNKVPNSIKSSKSISIAKREIKKYCGQLPI